MTALEDENLELTIVSLEAYICMWEERLRQVECELPKMERYKLELQRDIALGRLRLMEMKSALERYPVATSASIRELRRFPEENSNQKRQVADLT